MPIGIVLFIFQKLAWTKVCVIIKLTEYSYFFDCINGIQLQRSDN